MSTVEFNRRQFLQSAMISGLLGAAPSLTTTVQAAPVPLQKRLLANLYLHGGPDFRHLIVPAYDAAPNSFGNKYWAHRAGGHRLADTGVTAQQRWDDDYYPITVGGAGWNSGLADPGGLNTGVTFGIWREAGWLIDMFREGHIALIFNAVGSVSRAHDLSRLVMQQGNFKAAVNSRGYSGWGGRLARTANGNLLSLTRTPNPFCFGPLGDSPNYEFNAIDNIDLLSVENTREIGLFDFDFALNQVEHEDQKMARAAKSYYAALRQEQIATVYEKFLDHELKVRQFGELIKSRLDTVPITDNIAALYSSVTGIDGPINPNPSNLSQARRVLRTSSYFGSQIRNLYDVIAANDLLDPRVVSMEFSSGWDSHVEQRRLPPELIGDPHNPYVYRGIESGFKDIFGGQFGATPSDANAWHGGLSALWSSLPNSLDQDRFVMTIQGEFGRQIRSNGGLGTDHGKGNLMFVIGKQCNGGVYGELFPDSEIDKYDNMSLNTPDIDPRTEIDSIFSKVCDWVEPNSGATVFPRTASTYSGDLPLIEVSGMFDNLMT